ncbi:hypothetical protein LWI29_000601 [Acer saccharum]|uniref:DUF4216 domain-containing protein n=1 Tax=Acer saccharum TaxID=4024 RepID=A0AA39T0J9_ACESA|nr:hypothetical protein LWI29_000601 [Acer saccharum]
MLGKPFGKAEVKELSVKYHDIATFYVLQNCEESQPFVRREGRGYKRDRYGIVTVNIKRKLNTQDTFVLACQANQAYYTEGMLDNTWSAVNEIKSRNLYEMPVDGEPYQEETQFNGTNVNQEVTRKKWRDVTVVLKEGKAVPFKAFGKVRDEYFSSNVSAIRWDFDFIRYGFLEEASKKASQVKRMKVYGWPFQSKVASFGRRNWRVIRSSMGSSYMLGISDSHLYEDKLPRVDIFVCTADPVMEPPIMVINTVLSAMPFNYPPDKLSVYLSDYGGSQFTFYALLEASNFSKYWLPFCKKFIVEPRNPEAYFAQVINGNADLCQELLDIKMGLIYGCAVEDLVTGLTIQCRGWKSAFYNPKREAILGVAPTTLEISLLQFKRWSEGLFQIFVSKYYPFIYGHGKIKFSA